MGGKVDPPMLQDRLDELDAWLAAEPKVHDPVDAELRQALGLKVAG